MSILQKWYLIGMPWLAAVALLITSCAPAGDSITAYSLSQSRVRPMCVSGCGLYDPGPDPHSNSAGVWVGDDFSYSNCFSENYEDNDHDGIVDMCEWVLARHFAPVMIFDSGDEVGREPYFAARSLGNGFVLILYMPAYYMDWGCSSFMLCGTFDDGHNGDAETIAVVVQWNEQSEHWVLKEGFLSVHFGNRVLASGNNEYPIGFEYPNEAGGRFLVHVANGKHGNFETRYACNHNGLITEDVCNNGASTGDTLFTDLNRNIGSWDYQLKNCVTSVGDPFSEWEECFWTGYPGFNKFFGWSGPSSDGSDPYSEKLALFGFIPI